MLSGQMSMATSARRQSSMNIRKVLIAMSSMGSTTQGTTAVTACSMAARSIEKHQTTSDELPFRWKDSDSRWRWEKTCRRRSRWIRLTTLA
ncbi:hypothetical protein D3C72_1656220 [compost metagenome]